MTIVEIKNKVAEKAEKAGKFLAENPVVFGACLMTGQVLLLGWTYKTGYNRGCEICTDLLKAYQMGVDNAKTDAK